MRRSTAPKKDDFLTGCTAKSHRQVFLGYTRSCSNSLQTNRYLVQFATPQLDSIARAKTPQAPHAASAAIVGAPILPNPNREDAALTCAAKPLSSTCTAPTSAALLGIWASTPKASPIGATPRLPICSSRSCCKKAAKKSQWKRWNLASFTRSSPKKRTRYLLICVDRTTRCILGFGVFGNRDWDAL